MYYYRCSTLYGSAGNPGLQTWIYVCWDFRLGYGSSETTNTDMAQYKVLRINQSDFDPHTHFSLKFLPFHIILPFRNEQVCDYFYHHYHYYTGYLGLDHSTTLPLLLLVHFYSFYCFKIKPLFAFAVQ